MNGLLALVKVVSLEKRVTIYDKITKNDINQLRDVVEVLSEHYHDYTDRTGC